MRHYRFAVLLLAAVALLLFPVSVSLGQPGVGVKRNPHTSGADNMTVYDVTDAQYGAIADAVEASSCDDGGFCSGHCSTATTQLCSTAIDADDGCPGVETCVFNTGCNVSTEAADCPAYAANETCTPDEDIPMDCDVPGTGTDNLPAFNAAVTAACAAGGGVIYIPKGPYRMGTATGAGGALSAAVAWRIPCDNIHIQGDGPASVLLPAGDVGQVVIALCEGTLGGNCVDSNPAYNFTVSDITIRDDDPYMHGCGYCGSLEVENITGAFTFGEVITFTGGETAQFFWQSADAGAGRFIYMYPDGDTIDVDDIDDQITGATSTETADILNDAAAIITEPTAEETHGIGIYNGHNVVIERVLMEFVGDEGMDTHRGTSSCGNVRIENNQFNHMPGVPSSGAAISIGGTIGSSVVNNDIILGVGSHVLGGNTGIALTGIVGVVTSDNQIIGNRILEPDDDKNDHRAAELGIVVASGLGNIERTLILGNTIEVDNDNVVNLGCTDCNSILVSDGGSFDTTSVTVDSNILVGAVSIDTRGTGSVNIVTDNNIQGAYQDGLLILGPTNIVKGNAISGFGGRGIFVSGNLSTSNTIIEANILLDLGADLVATSGLIGVLSSAAVENLKVTNNIIVGKNVGATTVSGINCARVLRSEVSGNTIEDADDNGVNQCLNVFDNIIRNPAGSGIRSIDIFAQIYDNVIYDAGNRAVIESAGFSAFTRCEGNASISTDLIDVSPSTVAIGALGACAGAGDDGDIQAVNDPNDTLDCTVGGGFDVSHWCECDFSGAGVWQNYGIDYGIAAGDDVNWNGAAEDGVVVSVDVDTSVTIVPDNFGADVVAATDEITDGTWQLISVAVDDVGAVGADIDCSDSGSTENDNVRIPAP